MNLIDIVHAAPEALEHTTEETGENGGVLGSLGINPTLFIFQLINFAIVAAIIWFLILKPLTKKMSERQQMIDKSLKDAKQIEKNLAHSEQKYQERIDQAKADASKIIEKAQYEAVSLADTMKANAKKEIEDLVDQARKNIKTEREEAVKEVKQQAADMITAATEKILGTQLDKQADAKIIEDTLKTIK